MFNQEEEEAYQALLIYDPEYRDKYELYRTRPAKRAKFEDISDEQLLILSQFNNFDSIEEYTNFCLNQEVNGNLMGYQEDIPVGTRREVVNEVSKTKKRRNNRIDYRTDSDIESDSEDSVDLLKSTENYPDYQSDDNAQSEYGAQDYQSDDNAPAEQERYGFIIAMPNDTYYEGELMNRSDIKKIPKSTDPTMIMYVIVKEYNLASNYEDLRYTNAGSIIRLGNLQSLAKKGFMSVAFSDFYLVALLDKFPDIALIGHDFRNTYKNSKEDKIYLNALKNYKRNFKSATIIINIHSSDNYGSSHNSLAVIKGTNLYVFDPFLTEQIITEFHKSEKDPNPNNEKQKKKIAKDYIQNYLFDIMDALDIRNKENISPVKFIIDNNIDKYKNGSCVDRVCSYIYELYKGEQDLTQITKNILSRDDIFEFVKNNKPITDEDETDKDDVPILIDHAAIFRYHHQDPAEIPGQENLTLTDEDYEDDKAREIPGQEAISDSDRQAAENMLFFKNNILYDYDYED